MLKKIQTILCFAIIAGFVCIAGYSGADKKVISTSANINTSASKPIVVLDAGHGGMDGGCVSVDGTPEKGINLNIMKTLRDSLKVLGYEVICTRESDVSIHDKDVKGTGKQKLSDMKNRLAIFSKHKDGVSISIHQNQFTDASSKGAQMFYSAKSSESERLAGCMQKQFVSFLQPDNKRETKGVGDELYLLNNTENPAVMIECGFLSNPEEAKKLESTDYQKQVAFTILTGLCEFKAE